MVNRRHWALMAMVLVGIVAILLLARSYKTGRSTPPAAGQERVEAEIKRQAQDLPAEGIESSAVPESPRHMAGEIEKHRLERLTALDKAVREQEDKVEERRKVLATIVRTKGIIYKGTDSPHVGEANARTGQESRNHLEQAKMQLESQIGSMEKYQGEQLMVYAAGLDIPDNSVKVLYPQYLEVMRGLDTLKKSGLGAAHPTLKAQVDRVEAFKSRIDEGIANLKATTQAQFEMAQNHLKSAEAATREENIKRGLDAQAYVEAKREFETDQKLLQEMRLKRIAEELKAKHGGR